jgi:hypothetical protein
LRIASTRFSLLSLIPSIESIAVSFVRIVVDSADVAPISFRYFSNGFCSGKLKPVLYVSFLSLPCDWLLRKNWCFCCIRLFVSSFAFMFSSYSSSLRRISAIRAFDSFLMTSSCSSSLWRRLMLNKLSSSSLFNDSISSRST